MWLSIRSRGGANSEQLMGGEGGGRWEEEGGRGGPNMTCVSVC